MSGDVETVSPRPRPLSGGLWTLFSWLRRDEHSSSESLSSAGSDRTAASFAFLGPGHYCTVSPALLPPPPPPTDSYKKRVHDRNVRRQHERDITLHRKYGLYGFGYDAFSLPSARRASVAPGSNADRDRRASSECPRAHVPGKRRAPLPPSAPSATSTLNRRRARKRPAPLPPLDLIKENVDDAVSDIGYIEPMNPNSHRDEQLAQNYCASGCKPEKYSKTDAQTKETKDVKIRHEKSFLKQIFENRKRNSAIETSSVKLLPNISELDKQAAEMIEKYRLKELTRNDVTDKDSTKNDSPGSSKQQMEAWICTRCLRKYNSSVITCNYCLPLNKVNDSWRSSKAISNCSQTNFNPTSHRSASKRDEDKEKLKEMLKEMKDSLPKKPKNDISKKDEPQKKNVMQTKEECPRVVEAPTLRIGSTNVTNEKNPIDQLFTTSSLQTKPSTSQLQGDANKEKELTTINSVTITQPVVLIHTRETNVFLNNDIKLPLKEGRILKDTSPNTNRNNTEIERIQQTNVPKPSDVISKDKYDLNTPLKISSLLNPIYVPKTTSTTNTQTPNPLKQIEPATISTQTSLLLNSTVPSTSQSKQSILIMQTTADKEKSIENVKENSTSYKKNTQVILDDKKTKDGPSQRADKPSMINNNIKQTTEATPSANEPSTSSEGRLDQHARRRDLINQLEKSIANGDEHAAAEAAVKLAQLRLSCSVLSFSSQIVADALTSSSIAPQLINDSNLANLKKNTDAIQTSSQTCIEPKKADSTKQSIKITSEQNVKKNLGEEKQIVFNIENTIIKTTNNSSILIKKENEKKSVSNNCVLPLPPCEASTSKSFTQKENDTDDVPILVWVEDKEATRGPVQLHVRRNAVMGDLREQAEKSLGLSARMQRWIVGRNLCSDDNTPLVTLAGAELSAPFYLCLVESDTKDPAKPHAEVKTNEDLGNVYNELVKLEKQPLVSNADVFECGVCMEQCTPGHGVVLKECVHSFCKQCLSDVVRHSEEPVVSCPAMGCSSILQEREIKGLVTLDEYEKWLARGLAAAESGTRNAFHCRTRDCTGWALCEPGVRRFPCPVCKRANCVPCQAIHEGQTCDQHRAKIKESAATLDGASQTDEGTRALLNTLISRGEALECPECSAIITKKWGCDWVKCSACKTEICWVTKGRRWGPAGRGDTSAGCRCGVDGKRCHPSCGYCH